ncbi:MAG: TraB/GumN family protein [Muribaculaceae bacterium]|nr:TraB/GumN family protein [Muribaculaceae bacterium]
MKRFILSLIIAVAVVSTASAQLLWKITPPGADAPTSYLFGTHHVAPISVLDSVPGFTEALKAVDQVYGEMDMTSAQTSQAQQIIMTAGMAPADSLLTMVLTPAQQDSVNTVIKKYMGAMADISQMAPLKPAMVSTVLAMLQAQQQFPDFNAAQQIDGEIQVRAKAVGKTVAGLETVEQQASLLFGSPILKQAEELMEAVRHDGMALDFSRRLAQAYLQGDLNAMLQLMEDPNFGMAEASDSLIRTRNLNWMKVIAALLPTASVLIAVGAGHLPGEDGLISLLRKEGFNVTPVK